MLEHLNPDALKLLVSLFFGSVIGLEREVSDKAAGLRTNILICVGACLYTVLSAWFVNDPARVAAQLVSGIGFLGAGSIMREGDKVTGLTTAATIWVVAAIGMAAGYGHFTLAATVTLMVLFVQLAFTQLDIMIDDWRERHTYKIVSKLDEKSFEEISEYFRECKIHVMRRKLMKKNGMYFSEWYTTGGRIGQDRVKRKLLECASIVEVTY